jgi:hypothetical protein
VKQPTTVFDNWAGGVITTMRPDALPNAASPRGRNSILSFLAGGQAVAAKRPGFELINTAPVTGRPTVIGQFEFNRNNAGVATSTHLIVSSDGTLTKPNGAATPVAVDGATPTPFTAGNLYPVFAVLNNLCFIVNGTDKKKLSSAGTVQNWGIVRPTAPTAVDSGVAGTPSGTYQFARTFYNSTTGHESSRSDLVSVTVAGKKITVSWVAPADPQVDYVFIYVRKASIMSEFFRLIVGTTPASATNGGFAVVTTSITVDVTDAQLTALELLSPDTAENEPPPSGLVAAAPHISRMFVADKSQIYYSKPKLPEAFDPDYFEPVNSDDGQDIVAIGSFFERLVVWKTDSMYGLYGQDPNNWYLDVIDPKIGATSAASIKYHDGLLTWWSKFGPVAWSGDGPPTLIGAELIASTIARSALNYGALNQIVSEIDLDTHTVLFAVPESGETRNTLILPFNIKNKVWHSDGWNAFDIASMAVVKDANGKPWVVVGNYGGRLFRFANANPDGARTADGAGTLFTLSGPVTSATATTLTDSSATFDTTDDALKELYVYARDAAGVVQRRRITANTGTQLTISAAWDAIPDTTYTYSIGAPYWQWDTKWTNEGLPFIKKVLQHQFAQVLSDTGSAQVQVDVFGDYDSSNPLKTFSFSASGDGGIFDVSLFDDAIFGEMGITYNRQWVGRRVRTYRLRYSNVEPNSQIALVQCGVIVKPLSDKR